MCWFSEDLPKEQIAKEDIICYKVVLIKDETIESYCRGFRYEWGKLYTQYFSIKILSSEGGLYRIEKAFHSYCSKPSLDFNDRLSIIKGSYYKNPDTHLVKCIIPKGSHYYQNNTEYASDCIIIKERIY